ncbi:MAG TPA: hypothetical protein PKH72_10020, partial [Rhodoferax sp.]|nr:hypothetical protein [Rhodoferax sp.]
ICADLLALDKGRFGLLENTRIALIPDILDPSKFQRSEPIQKLVQDLKTFPSVDCVEMSKR